MLQSVQDIDITKKNILINGDVQSGKTSVIIELALRLYNENKNVFIFVNNFNMDLLQIKTRFNNYFKEHNLINCLKVIDKKIKKKDIEERSIYVALCNASKISDINSHFKNEKYCCIIDESDLFNQDSEKNDKDTLNKVSKELNSFLTNAEPIVRVTATSFSHMYVNEVYPLKGDDVYFMNKKDSYISFGHSCFKVLPLENPKEEKEKEKYEESENENSEENSENDSENESEDPEESEEPVKEADLYLNTKTFQWTDRQKEIFYNIVENDRKYFESKGISPIMIVNVSTLVKNHSYIKNVINEKYSDITTILINESNVSVEFFDKKISRVINENFNTVQEALTSIKSSRDSFNLEKKRNSLQNKSNKSDQDKKELDKINELLEYSFSDKHEHPMVIIITCLQMGRGISPRSEVLNFKNIKSIIYANSMIYCCSRSQSIDKIIQGSMRIGGQFPGYEKIEGFELRLHTTNNIIKAISDQYEWFFNIKENIQENSKLKLTELITPLKEKPLRKPISSSRGKFKCKKINGVYECSEDRIILAQNNEDPSNKSIRQNILEVLNQNKETKLTALQIKEKGLSIKLWNTDTPQLYRNITNVLSKKEDNISREKNSEGIYIYWIN